MTLRSQDFCNIADRVAESSEELISIVRCLVAAAETRPLPPLNWHLVLSPVLRNISHEWSELVDVAVYNLVVRHASDSAAAGHLLATLVNTTLWRRSQVNNVVQVFYSVFAVGTFNCLHAVETR